MQKRESKEKFAKVIHFLKLEVSTSAWTSLFYIEFKFHRVSNCRVQACIKLNFCSSISSFGSSITSFSGFFELEFSRVRGLRVKTLPVFEFRVVRSSTSKCNQTIYLCKHFTAVPQMMTNGFCKQLFALCWKDRLTTATKCVKMGNSFTNKNALSEQQQEMLEIFWKDKRFFMWNKKPQIKHSNWVICRKCICRLLIMCYQFRYVPRP